MPRYYVATTENAEDLDAEDGGLEFDRLTDACNEAERGGKRAWP